MKSYLDLEIYRNAYDQALKIHKLTMQLPKYELFEVGSQIRRSSKSILFNIVEGYGRRRYKKEFLRFIVFAHASNMEVSVQLKMISDLHFEKNPLNDFHDACDELGRKIYRFIKYVEKNWNPDLPKNKNFDNR